MGIQYKPTKPKKEKPQKTPKEPKREKEVKLGGAVKLDTAKPEKQKKIKEPKIKAPKAEKIQPVNMQKPEKAEKFEVSGAVGQSVLKKPVSPVLLLVIIAVVAVAAVLVFTVLIPAVEKQGETIRGITISAMPDKTVYLIGEKADYAGLRVTVERNNGDTFIVRATDCEITDFDSSKAGSVCVNVKYGGFVIGFYIEVKEPPKVTPNLARITLETLPKTEYKIGEWLDTSGGVILCEYVDGSTSRTSLVNSFIYGFKEFDIPGTYTLTVKYVERGIICKTTYDITVTE